MLHTRVGHLVSDGHDCRRSDRKEIPMIWLVSAGVFFLGIHVFVSGTRLRRIIAARTGERAFQGIFSLLSLAGIIWLCRAYAGAPYVGLWGPAAGFVPLALVLMFLAFQLAAIGLTTPSPTVTGGGSQLDRNATAEGILRITRHPFLWGVAAWAFGHLVLNGDAASLVFFGTFLFLALIGPPLIDAKRKATFGARWDRFAAVTSSVPFGAIIQGRNSFKLEELGWWRIALGLVLYAVFLYFHVRLFGTSPYGV
jgi:uncharacterized membrane protein